MSNKTPPVLAVIRTQHARAKKAGVLNTLTLEEWEQIILDGDGRCSYCGSIERVGMEHKTPISRGGPNVAANVTLACHSCNSKKRNRTPEEWAAAKVKPEAVSLRGPGRPPGIHTLIKDPVHILHPHTVRLTDAEWEACVATGDASGFIRRAIKKILKNT